MPLNTVSFASVWVETEQGCTSVLYCCSSSLQDRTAPILELVLPLCSTRAVAVWEVLQCSAYGLALGRVKVI